MRIVTHSKIILSCSLSLMLVACGGNNSPINSDSSLYDSPTPKVEKAKVGRPYQIKGQWYKPEVDMDYDETGIASWYGPGFHGRPTANGERFDENQVSAAHKTLPLPSYVEVTNLDNGKQLYVRVNDRGPFADSRIIDLSKRAAEILGSKATGLANVRVRLAEPPKNVTVLLPDGQKIIGKGYKPNTQNTMVAQNNTPQPKPTQNYNRKNIPLYQGSDYQQADIVANNIPSGITQDYEAVNQPIEQYEPQQVAQNNTAQGYPINGTQIDDIINYSDNNQGIDAVTSNNYSVQVGVFSNPDNIRNLQDKIQTLGNVTVKPVNQDGRLLSKVSLGPYKNQELAISTVDALAEMGINDAVISQ